MTDIELTILKHLYINPLEVNFTKSVLNNSLAFDKIILENNVQSLLDNRYIETIYTENQKILNDPCYRITGFGAKKINELEGKGLKAVIAKYGAIISLLVGLIGAIGVGAKIYFDNNTDKRGCEQLKIQRQQLQIQQQMFQQRNNTDSSSR